MIVTLTANPSFDRTIELAGRLQRGGVLRADAVLEQAGGKGVNISRAATAADVPTVAVFPAETDSAFATELEHAAKCQWIQRSLPDGMPLLKEAYEDCEKALVYWTGPYVLSQGDFAPWNIRTFGSQLFVFDWGDARADASPLDDVLHYLMIQRRLKSVPLLRGAMARAREFALAAYPEWSWRPQVIGALTIVYLLGVILHRGAQRADPVVEAYCKLLEKRSIWMKEN